MKEVLDKLVKECEDSFMTKEKVKQVRIARAFLLGWQDIEGKGLSLEDYTDQQLELVVLQRLKYSQVDYDDEKILWLVVEYGLKDLHKIIRLLKDAITIMLSEGRTVLTM